MKSNIDLQLSVFGSLVSVDSNKNSSSLLSFLICTNSKMRFCHVFRLLVSVDNSRDSFSVLNFLVFTNSRYSSSILDLLTCASIKYTSSILIILACTDNRYKFSILYISKNRKKKSILKFGYFSLVFVIF